MGFGRQLSGEAIDKRHILGSQQPFGATLCGMAERVERRAAQRAQLCQHRKGPDGGASDRDLGRTAGPRVEVQRQKRRG